MLRFLTRTILIAVVLAAAWLAYGLLLPPGPISSPGRASLQAAMHPVSTDYLYFVSDNHGHHRFSRTASEHSRNVTAYRRAVAQSMNR
jgi:cell division protein YceG involved in septum cleavage